MLIKMLRRDITTELNFLKISMVRKKYLKNKCVQSKLEVNPSSQLTPILNR